MPHDPPSMRVRALDPDPRVERAQRQADELSIRVIAAENEAAGLREQVRRLEKSVDTANATALMYSNAWQREIAAFDGTIRRKGHHIDALVLTTQALVQRNIRVQAALRAKLAAPEYGLYCFTRAELEAMVAP